MVQNPFSPQSNMSFFGGVSDMSTMLPGGRSTFNTSGPATAAAPATAATTATATDPNAAAIAAAASALGTTPSTAATSTVASPFAAASNLNFSGAASTVGAGTPPGGSLANPNAVQGPQYAQAGQPGSGYLNGMISTDAAAAPSTAATAAPLADVGTGGFPTSTLYTSANAPSQPDINGITYAQYSAPIANTSNIQNTRGVTLLDVWNYWPEMSGQSLNQIQSQVDPWDWRSMFTEVPVGGTSPGAIAGALNFQTPGTPVDPARLALSQQLDAQYAGSQALLNSYYDPPGWNTPSGPLRGGG